MSMYPGKSLTVGGHATIGVDGNRLIIEGGEGLIAATVVDLRGSIVYMHHPLSGWYVELDLPRHDAPPSEEQT